MLHILSAQTIWGRIGDDLIGGAYIVYRLIKEMLVG